WSKSYFNGHSPEVTSRNQPQTTMCTPSNDYEWKRCKRCRLYATRRFVVLNRTGYVRGGRYYDTPQLPPNYPHLLFIGEAPESQEDHTGLPFQGNSGRILHFIWSFVESPFAYTITNAVGCRPTELDKRGAVVNRSPTQEEQDACRPRLQQLVESTHFDGVVYLGKVAAGFTPKTFLGPKNLFTRALQMMHPATILRMEYKLFTIKQQALELNRYVDSTSQTR